jgi:hypothetical protein
MNTSENALKHPPCRRRSRAAGTRRTGGARTTVIVLILVVGLFVAIVPLWVLNQRSEQRSLTCQFHQQRIIEAFHRYDSEYGELPPYRANRFNRGPQEVSGPEDLIAWTFPLLPLLFERRQPADDDPSPNWHHVYTTYGPAAGAAERKASPEGRVSLYICPADPNHRDDAALSYAANAGQPDVEADPADYVENGLLMDASRGMRSWSLKRLSAADGTAHTILIAENMDAGEWNASSEAEVSILWSPAGQVLWLNEQIGLGSTATETEASMYSRPSSYHPRGINIGLAGGAVRTLSIGIDRRIYRQMLTADDF